MNQVSITKDQLGRIHVRIGGFITVLPSDFSKTEALVEVGSFHTHCEESGVSTSWSAIQAKLDHLFTN